MRITSNVLVTVVARTPPPAVTANLTTPSWSNDFSNDSPSSEPEGNFHVADASLDFASNFTLSPTTKTSPSAGEVTATSAILSAGIV